MPILPRGCSGPVKRVSVSTEACARRVGVLVGVFVVAVTLAHIPASVDALNYFDVPKRLVWAILAVFLAGVTSFRGSGALHDVRCLALLCALWMVGRSVLRPCPTAELEVLAAWGLPFILFAVGSAMDRERAVRPLVWALAICGIAQAGVMLLQYAGKDPLFAATTGSMVYRPGRMIGTVGYHNQAAACVVLSVGVAALVCGARRLMRWLLFGGMLLVVGLTGSRGAILAGVLSVGVVEFILAMAGAAPGHRSRAWRRLGFVIMLAAVLLACIPVTRDRMVDVATRRSQSPAVASRLVMARVAVSMWRERPAVGWGAGEYARQYLDRLGDAAPAEMSHDVLRSRVFARETHNDYLQFGAEFGLIGVGLCLVLFFCAIRLLRRAWPNDRTYVACCVFILCYMSSASLVTFPWQTSLAGPLAGLLLGVLLPRETQAATCLANSGRRGERAVPFMSVVLAVLGLVWSVMEAVTNVALPARLKGGAKAVREVRVPGWMYKHHALLGGALGRLGANEEALSHLRHAYAGYRDLLLYNNLGHVLSEEQEWPAAIDIYREWAQTGIDHRTALGNLSIAQEQAHDYAGAAETLGRLRQLWPDDDMEAAQRHATLHLLAGDPALASAVLHRYETAHCPGQEDRPAEFDNLVGAALLALGETERAVARFRLALRKDPELRSAARNLETALLAPTR